DEGFAEFYASYQHELNTIGKRPDLLIFRVADFPDKEVDTEMEQNVRKAVAAFEVRSSSFLHDSYSAFMREREKNAINKCIDIKKEILSSNLGGLLKRKNNAIYELLQNATNNTFKELDFRRPS